MKDENNQRLVILHSTHSKNNKPLFPGNQIRTTKYTILTFIPKNLFFQFSRIANFYFLIIVSMLQFSWAPISATAALLPLAIVIGVSAIREAIEDYLRYRSDQLINSSTSHCLKNGEFVDSRWDQIYVGDIIKIYQDEQAPADVVILASSDNEGTVYIDTCNLDGESNLKNRQALRCTLSILDFQSLQATIACELPNRQLSVFHGYLDINGEQHSLENKQIMLRGSSVRNTKWVIGAVIYTGHQSKIMMNSSSARTKRSFLERRLNLKLVSIFLFLFALSVIGATLGFLFEKNQINTGNHWYFFREDNPRSSIKCFFVLLACHIIVMNTMVPISLYVTLEVVRVIQALFTVWDVEMYDPDSKSFALVRTTNISDDLGQIEYIFSDKTGTLTQNVMEFMKCSIAGKKYGDGTTEVEFAVAKRRGIQCKPPNVNGKAFESIELDQIIADRENLPKEYKLFFWTLAACHSVIPKEDPSKPHGIDFQASSPDEGALVAAAADFGYVFTSKHHNVLGVKVNGVDKEVELLANLEFSSERKRSSVVFRYPETGHIILLCKGADDLIYQRLSKDSKYQTETKHHMMEFADAGLRTLCCAYKIVDEAFFQEWYIRYQEANCAINDREQRVEEVSNEIENDLKLIGATAIEDKLQIGVSDTIESLLRAKIKVWVITGDKRETAINIGFACNLLSAEMLQVIFDSDSEEELQNTLENALNVENKSLALVASGTALEKLMSNKSTENKFMELAIKCQSVICCRVSPLQKALIVEKMRKKTKKLALAIGDGANDVGMILKADVGVGISGKEGRQAVLAADYAISQFRFLKRLLLVHGRLNFYRNVDLINYCFYKNMVLTINQMIFACFSSFSGVTMYDSYLFMIYNVVFTSIPPVIYACFEKDVPLKAMSQLPELYYMDGKRMWHQSYLRFWLNLLLGIFHAFITFFVPFFGMIPYVGSDGYSESLENLGTTIYCSVVIITNIKIASMCLNWTWLHHVSIWFSIFIFPLIAIIIQKLDFSPGFTGAGLDAFGSTSFWFSVIGSVLLSIFPVIGISAVENSVNSLKNRVLFVHKRNINIFKAKKDKRIKSAVSFSSIYQTILNPNINIK